MTKKKDTTSKTSEAEGPTDKTKELKKPSYMIAEEEAAKKKTRGKQPKDHSPRPLTKFGEIAPAMLPTNPNTSHMEVEVTSQDLPDNRTKTFMGKPVAQQRKFDDEAAARFLGFYAMTGRMSDSAKAAGVSYDVVNHWDNNDEDFHALVLEAKQEFLEVVEREIFRRAIEGVLEPVVAGKDPEIVTYVRRYSDKLLELMAKKHDPSGYGNGRAATEVNVNVKTGVMVASSGQTLETTPFKIEDVEADQR